MLDVRWSFVTFAVAASVLVATGSAGAGPQVTIYLGGYGPPNAAPQAPPGPATPPGGAGTVQTELAFAQGAAYQRYLQYVAALSYQSSRAPATDPGQYFTNGAAATTVPSAGPGSAYFTNGAEATRVAPPAAPPTPAQPPPPPPPPPPSAPLAPFWWVESATPPIAAPSAALVPPLAPAPAPAEARAPEVAMSFEEWLESMGANTEEPRESPPAAATPDVESALVASAAVFDVRQRTPYATREKRERASPSGSSSGFVAVMIGTFAIGLALGALAMRHGPLRAGPDR